MSSNADARAMARTGAGDDVRARHVRTRLLIIAECRPCALGHGVDVLRQILDHLPLACEDATMDPYAQQLLDAVSAALPDWLERSVVGTSIRLTRECPPEIRTAAAAMAARCAPLVMKDLELLLATDVDRQQSNPLSVLRRAVRYPTELLANAGLPPPRRDEFAVRVFPDDIYALSPATWTDIDESLQEPGLIWGAWKAKTVLDRRRRKEPPEPELPGSA